MSENEKSKRLKLPDEDYVVYIPDEDYYSFMRSLDKLEEARKELHKIRDSIKSNDNNSIGNQSLE